MCRRSSRMHRRRGVQRCGWPPTRPGGWRRWRERWRRHGAPALGPCGAAFRAHASDWPGGQHTMRALTPPPSSNPTAGKSWATLRQAKTMPPQRRPPLQGPAVAAARRGPRAAAMCGPAARWLRWAQQRAAPLAAACGVAPCRGAAMGRAEPDTDGGGRGARDSLCQRQRGSLLRECRRVCIWYPFMLAWLTRGGSATDTAAAAC